MEEFVDICNVGVGIVSSWVVVYCPDAICFFDFKICTPSIIAKIYEMIERFHEDEARKALLRQLLLWLHSKLVKMDGMQHTITMIIWRRPLLYCFNMKLCMPIMPK